MAPPTQEAICSDGKKDENSESDLDCGNKCSTYGLRCADEMMCQTDNDCQNQHCPKVIIAFGGVTAGKTTARKLLDKYCDERGTKGTFNAMDVNLDELTMQTVEFGTAAKTENPVQRLAIVNILGVGPNFVTFSGLKWLLVSSTLAFFFIWQMLSHAFYCLTVTYTGQVWKVDLYAAHQLFGSVD